MRNVIFIALLASSLHAAETAFDPAVFMEREVVATRLAAPLTIDGLLGEPIYRTQPNQIFIQMEPDNGQLATEKTDVWIAYDDVALYVSARLWDSRPDSIVARMGRRDSDLDSDFFQVAIDAYNDKRSAFFFSINPSGAIQDGTIANDSWFDDSWDGIWTGEATIDAQGWTVELRIPFSQLRFNRQDEYVWGIGLSRGIQRRNEFSLFTYVPRGETGVVSHFATLQGIRNIHPPRRLEAIPYLTSSYSRLPSKQENPFFQGRDAYTHIGADLKLGIGSNLTLDMTLNPDFGQVEVDPSVINLSAYETYYQEKRPFFIEGANIFSFGHGGPTSRWGFNFWEPNFFYSRRIGRPPQGGVDTDGWVDTPNATAILGAAKLSGKLNGDWALGGLTSVTRREFAEVNEDGKLRSVEVEPLTSYNLIRTQKEFNDGRQGLGMIGTYVHRQFDDSALKDVLNGSAFASGIDGWTFLGEEKDWAVAGWAGFTSITGSEKRMLDIQESSGHYFQRPDADHVTIDSAMTRMAGYAGRIMVNKEGGHLVFNSALGVISPGFESNDLGLAGITDRINMHMATGYRWYDPGKVFRNAQITTAYMSNHNFGGTKLDEGFYLFGWFQFLNYWSFNGFMGWSPQTPSSTKLRGGPMVMDPSGVFMNLHVSSDSRKSVVFGLGGFASHSSQSGKSRSINSRVELKVGTRLNLNVGPNYSVSNSTAQYVTAIEDANATVMYGQRYVVARLDQQTLSADFRVNYTFTPTLSLQAYFQPYISVGAYSDFKEFKRPRSYDFLVYGEEGSTIRSAAGEYVIDPTGGDDGDAFTIDDPDFNFKALVGTAVLRWEFTPGSTFYLVWTRNGSDDQYPGEFRVRRDLSELFQAAADNFFAVKVTYWLGR